jgi:uncharacterized protein
MRVRLGPWQALVVFIASWVVVDLLFEFARDQVLVRWQFRGVREVVAVRALFNVGIMWAMFAVCVLILRLRGQKLADVGWRRSASRLPWILAIALAVLFSGTALATVGRSAQLFSDWSFYRISLALVIGISAGVSTELIFRGFVMTQARDAKLSVVIQILLSAVLFALALARFGWGGTPGHQSLWMIVATMPAAGVLGAILAIIYVVGRRSLMPVIVAHAAIDMIVEPGMLIFAAMGGVMR